MMAVIRVSAQRPEAICRTVQKGQFNKAERFIKKETRKLRNGVLFDNGPGSGMQVSHVESLDSIVSMLKKLPCVEDAFWDRCQIKIAIYPGWSVIGVRFRTHDGITEKCFTIQEGTTGTVQLPCWRPKLFKARNALLYKKMAECPGFIEQQRKLCEIK
jgi:hypothetical protein